MATALVASFQSPGSLYGTNLNQTTNGAMAQLTSGLGANPIGITFDGQYL
jgi:hypothetical protein